MKMVEHPERVEIRRQLDDVRRRRDRLFVDRTAMHPLVRSADVEILDLEKRLAAIPHELVPAPGTCPRNSSRCWTFRRCPRARWIRGRRRSRLTRLTEADEATPPRLPWPEVVKDYTESRDNLAHAREEYEKRAKVERETWEMRYRLPQIEVELARPAKLDEAEQGQAEPLGGLVAGGTRRGDGHGMLTMGMTREPILVTEAQVRSLLPVPVVATVPPADRSAEKPRPRRRPDGWILAVCGVLLMLLCLGKVLSALWGVQLG